MGDNGFEWKREEKTRRRRKERSREECLPWVGKIRRVSLAEREHQSRMEALANGMRGNFRLNRLDPGQTCKKDSKPGHNAAFWNGLARLSAEHS